MLSGFVRPSAAQEREPEVEEDMRWSVRAESDALPQQGRSAVS